MKARTNTTYGSPVRSARMLGFVSLACKWVAAGCPLALEQPMFCWHLRCQAGDAILSCRCNMPARSQNLQSGGLSSIRQQKKCDIPLGLQRHAYMVHDYGCNRTLSAGWQLLRPALEMGAPWGCDCSAAGEIASARSASAAAINTHSAVHDWWC